MASVGINVTMPSRFQEDVSVYLTDLFSTSPSDTAASVAAAAQVGILGIHECTRLFCYGAVAVYAVKTAMVRVIQFFIYKKHSIDKACALTQDKSSKSD